MGLKMKNYGESLKNPIFKKRFTKNQCIRGNYLKGRLWQFVDLRGTWQRTFGLWVCFWRGIDTPMHTKKLYALLHKTCIKVLRLDICTSMISLSKIAHQMWRDHLFSQRNKTTEWAVGVGVEGNREGELDKIWKSRDKQYMGSLHKIGRLGPHCQLW